MKKRTETISLTVTPEEKIFLKKLAEEANTSLSRLLYKIVFDALAKDKEQKTNEQHLR